MTSNAAASRLVDQLVAAYNSRTTDVLQQLYRDDITYWNSLDGCREGRQAVIDHIDHLHKILPDEQMRPLTVTADDDVIVVEFESTGTGPNGQPYRIEFTEVFAITDGGIASIKVYSDTDEIAAIST